MQDTGCNVFLTGKAGTGKTTFLRELCKKTYKRNVVLAPTGIAAINAHGTTLHSFFQLPFGPYIPGTELTGKERNFRFSERKRRLIRSLDLVIIDEISMVRADLLDSVDAVLRRYRDRTKPFGGVQMLLIGDLQQLAPVAKPEEWQLLKPYYQTQYFFSSQALREAGFVTVELKEIFRQKDEHFIDMLNRIRNNQADDAVLRELNARYVPGFVPREEEGYIRLTTHNWQADRINQEELDRLQTPGHTYEAEVWKDYPELSFPTAQSLELKVGAQVMFVKNDPSPQKCYFNGMIGTVASMADSFVKVMPQGGSELITVTPEQWENVRYTLDEQTKEVTEELIGTFKQLPLKTAWAITVHKSQGLTFERAIIDVQHSFSHGQTYVALSRCKSLEGMVLAAPIPRSAIITDQDVVAFTQSIPAQVPSLQSVAEYKRSFFLQLVADLFTFHALRAAFDAYLRYMDEWLYKQCGEEVMRWKALRGTYEERVEKVSLTFAQQYSRLIMSDFDYAANAFLQERISKAAEWFRTQLVELNVGLTTIHLSTRNKMVAERIRTLQDEFAEQLRQKLVLLTCFTEQAFTEESYLYQRSMVRVGPEEKAKTRAKAPAKKRGAKPTARRMADVDDVLQDLDVLDAMEHNDYLHEDLDIYGGPDLDHDGLPY